MKKQIAFVLVFLMIITNGLSGCSFGKETPKASSTGAVSSTSAAGNVAPTLRQLADQYGMLVGTCVEPAYLKEKDYPDVLKQQFNAITPENAMKWSLIHKEKDQYDFSGADAIMDFAQQNNMKVRGHNLVWHVQNPKWLEDGKWTKQELLDILKDHIAKVAGRYKGKIYAWDVCNEVISDTIPYEFRDSVWNRIIGEEYIEKAFQWAHEADPSAKLYLNDYDVEEKNPKSDFLFDLVKKLKDKKVPIDGVGFQFHIDIENPPDMSSVYENVKRFTSLGLTVDFTEIDVRIRGEKTPEVLKKQAQIYSDLMEIALSFDKTRTYSMWGFTDKHSWIPNSYQDFGSGLIYDENYKTKPAYDALISDLTKGPKGINFTERLQKEAISRNIIPAFSCNPVQKIPSIDGKEGKDEWKDSVAYKFAYNQLTFDQRPPLNQSDLYGEWRVLYNKNVLYGIVNREDNITYTDNSDSYNNDALELFIEINNQFVQLRSLVGHDFEDSPFPGKRSVKWSEDGKVCEFAVELPESDITGLTTGWNIALSDNDGQKDRKYQLYPFPGSNKSYMGKDLGALKFVGNTAKPADKNRIVPPFIARNSIIFSKPDGTESEYEYPMAYRYAFSYNQLNTMDQRPPKDMKDLYGDFQIMFKGNKIFGSVNRRDDKTVTDNPDPNLNDNVELIFKVDDKIYKLVSVVGKDFEQNELGDKAKAVWNKSGTTMEFSLELSPNSMVEQTIGFNIALSDNDGGDKLKWRLYPIPGEYNGDDTRSLCDLYFSPS